jgi:hypothetical protein
VATAPEGPNRYGVAVHRDESGWRVAIVDRSGREVSVRACSDEVEARTYASTVRQHVEWLSEPKFREYYRIPGGSGGLSERADQASGSLPAGGE